MINTFQLSDGIAEILGVKVNLINYAQTIASMEEAIKYRSTLSISFVNVHSIMTSQRDVLLKTALNSQFIIGSRWDATGLDFKMDRHTTQ